MMPRGAATDRSLTGAMLAGGAPHGLLGAGRGRDELLEEPERLARDRRYRVQRVQRARAVGRDLGLELLARAELVEDLADPFDAVSRERRRRLEQRGELRPQPRRCFLE